MRYAGRYDDGRRDAKRCMDGRIAIAIAVLITLVAKQEPAKNS
jgi:hypothetical protein